MNLEMRRKLAREPFEEKIRKVGQLIELARRFPKKPRVKEGEKERDGTEGRSGPS